MRSLILGLSFGRPEKKKKKPKKKNGESRTRRPSTSACEPENDKTWLNSNVNSEKKHDKTLTVLQSKLTMF